MKAINNRKFVKAWMTSDTINDVADKMRMTVSSAYAKAYNLRKRGVNLPDKKRVSTPHDTVEDLNKLIDELQPNKIVEDTHYNKGKLGWRK